MPQPSSVYFDVAGQNPSQSTVDVSSNFKDAESIITKQVLISYRGTTTTRLINSGCSTTRRIIMLTMSADPRPIRTDAVIPAQKRSVHGAKDHLFYCPSRSWVASWWLGVVCTVLMLTATALAAMPPAKVLYLLAGTPTSGNDFGLPVVLYYVRADRSLQLLRQVTDSLFDLRDDLDGDIYVINSGLTEIDVIHEDHPGSPDRIWASTTPAASEGWLNFYQSDWGVAAGSGFATSALLPRGKTRAVPYWTIVRIMGNVPAGPERVSIGESWSAYAHLRYAGPGGGPYRYIVPGLNLEGNELTLPVLGSGVGYFPVQRLPPAVLAAASAHSGAMLIADTALVFAFAYVPNAEAHAEAAVKSVHVLDRRSGKWSEPPNRFFSLPPRTFGAWLAFVAQEPANGRISPGLTNERSVIYGKGARFRRPNIRGQYPSDLYMPGEIDIYNFQDGREVAIRTGQQDSEVLDVSKSGQVVYRVNDKIFLSQIEGTQLTRAALIAQGDDVPEVHWAFWSDPQPASASAAASRVFGKQFQ